MKKLKGITRTLVCIGVFIAVAACESTDCPINNIVYSTYGFYAATDEGESKIQVLDTLTITAAGTDSILINRLIRRAVHGETPFGLTKKIFRITNPLLVRLRCSTM